MLTLIEGTYTLLALAGFAASGYAMYIVGTEISDLQSVDSTQLFWHVFSLASRMFGSLIALLYTLGIFLTATGPWEPSRTKLPNGVVVEQVSNGETTLLFKEIFQEACYSKVAKHVRPGATVVDAGANIGMFSLWAAELAGASGRVIAFEPIPATFRKLQFNMQHNYPASQSVDFSTYKFGSSKPCPTGGIVINEGLGSKASTPVFMSHPRMSVWSTTSKDLLENRPATALTGIVEGAVDRLPSLVRPIARPMIWLLFFPLMHISTQVLPVQCTIRPLSEHLDRLGISRIDLLKVDVEGAELEVMRGIRPEQWRGINAVVAETEAGNREAIMALLRGYGFRVRFEEPYAATEASMSLAAGEREGEGEGDGEGEGEGEGEGGADGGSIAKEKMKSSKRSSLAMVYAERTDGSSKDDVDEYKDEDEDEDEDDEVTQSGARLRKERAGLAASGRSHSRPRG